MNTKPKPVDQLTPYDFIMAELRGIREEMRNMRQEIRDVRQEVKDVSQEVKDVRTELNGRMDKLDKLLNEKSSTSKGFRISDLSNFDLWIITATVGIVCALIK